MRPDGDLGHNGDTSWASRTRTYLNDRGGDRNVVIWSWCGVNGLFYSKKNLVSQSSVPGILFGQQDVP